MWKELLDGAKHSLGSTHQGVKLQERFPGRSVFFVEIWEKRSNPGKQNGVARVGEVCLAEGAVCTKFRRQHGRVKSHRSSWITIPRPVAASHCSLGHVPLEGSPPVASTFSPGLSEE